LKIVSVHLDPLSKRREDILPLADYFRKTANKRHSRNVKGYSPALRRWLLDFSWKGNVRQLKNVVESLVVMDMDDMLDMDDLSPDLIETTPAAAKRASTSLNGSMPTDTSTQSNAGAQLASPALSPQSPSPLDELSNPLIGKSLKDIERWVIEHTLTLANHNREETANILGISERNLYRKLKEYELK